MELIPLFLRVTHSRSILPVRVSNDFSTTTIIIFPQIEGTTINVYGIMSWGSTGSVQASFNVDGYTTSQTFTANTAANNGLTNSTNYPFYSNTSLSSGNHTLTVNVTSVSGNLPFIIDYLTYQPNFDNIDSKPNFTAQAGIGSSTVPNSNPSSSAGSTSSDKTSKSHTGAIAGGVIGGLLAIAAILGAIFSGDEDLDLINQSTQRVVGLMFWIQMRD